MACENEELCTGYTISEFGFDCFVHGNISLANVANWSNSDAWMVGSEYVYGFLGFEVHASDDTSNLLCYKKINETYQYHIRLKFLSTFYMQKTTLLPSSHISLNALYFVRFVTSQLKHRTNGEFLEYVSIMISDPKEFA